MMNQIGFNMNSEKSEKVAASPFASDYQQKATIFGKHAFLPINYDRALNDNTLVIGTSGTGKTYSFVEPNILQANANYVIADAKGDILSEVGPSLVKQGYHLQVVNLVDLQHSMTYNPLKYMTSQTDVINFANRILKSDVAGNVTKVSNQDPFWDNAAATLLESIIFFVQENLPESEQTMATVTRLFNIINENPANIQNVLDSLGESEDGYQIHEVNYDGAEVNIIGSYLFDWVRKNDPQSVALQMWDKVAGELGAPHTWNCIVGILGSALSAYSVDEVENLMGSNQIDFYQLLFPKNALFIMYDDADSSKNFISNILYGQLIRYLYHAAFNQADRKLPVKVRFFLDDFKNINIPGFDDYLATARSRNISFCMMLQDESQLKTKFGTNTPSVIGNCSSYLLTGTTDLTMAEVASHRFDRDARAIRLMDQDHFLVDVGGHLAEPERYDFHDHPNYVNIKLDINRSFQTPKLNIGDDLWPNLREILKYLPHESQENNGFDTTNFLASLK